MSFQKIDLDVRHALWLSHNRRCVYCTEPLEFSETDIDHVIPERLVGTPELRVILERLTLPATFNLFMPHNLLPAHRRCNLAKASSVLGVSNTRFYLHLAEQASTRVASLLSAKTRSQRKETLVRAVGKAVRSGLVYPKDLVGPEIPAVLRLNKPLVFADAPEVAVLSIAPEDVETYLDRPVIFGGPISFMRSVGDEERDCLRVGTCREYRAAIAAGFYARTTLDIKSEGGLKVANALLTAATTVRLPIVSHMQYPFKGVSDLELLPCSVLPFFSATHREETLSTMKNLSLADVLRRGELTVRSVASSELSFVWQYAGMILREVCRADFDGDGIEDILCECYCWATEGSLGFGWTALLSRCSPDSMFNFAEF